MQKTPQGDPQNHLTTLLPTSLLRKPLPNHSWWQQPLMSQCFLDIGAACPEPAAGKERGRIQTPRVQDNAHPSATIACCFQHFLAGTVPWTQRRWFIPRFNRKKIFIRVNVRHCYRKQWCYYSYTRPWRCTKRWSLTWWSLRSLSKDENKIHCYCSMSCMERKIPTSVYSHFHHTMKDVPG